MTNHEYNPALIPWGNVGYITYKRTYSRKVKNDKTEEWEDTINRVVKACNEQLHVGFTEQENHEVKDMMMNLKGLVAGRFLWQLGTSTVDKLGLPSLQNCSACVIDTPIRPFTWMFELLMLGCGVGVNIQREHVYQLPKLKGKISIKRSDDNDVDFIVPDNREGWVKLLGKVLKSHFYSGKSFTYATHCIRSKGLPINGFGGVASGSEELVKGIQQIHDLLNNRANKKLRPIDCLDIACIIGQIVVSGNVRRSAIIALGDYDDVEFLNAKRWDLGNIPNWRSQSNNSVVCDDISKLPQLFWDGYEGKGEPYGLINLDASRKMGRTGDFSRPDPNIIGFNPCAEQSLDNYETCCLATTYLPNINSYEELLKVTKYLYRIAKHSLTIPCNITETEEIVHKNMRMGISMSGYLQATEEQRSWLSSCYEELVRFDAEYSKLHGFPTSIKLTTMKPDGTASLLAGVTSGAHPAFSKYYIRRIRIASDHHLINVCKEHGYKVEYQRHFDKSPDYTTQIIEFPCKVPEGTLVANEMSAIDQLNVIKRLQKEWSDNAVSVTIYYKPEELDSIKEWLSENYINVKSASFLLHSGHGFDQAPMEEITEERYNEMIKHSTQITHLEKAMSIEDINMNDCSTGACSVR